MKGYKRRIAIISPLIIAIAAFIASSVAVLTAVCSGTMSRCFIICAGISASLITVDLMNITAVASRYRYSNLYIEITLGLVCYKKIKYSSFDFIVISNASYHYGNCDPFVYNIPMQYKSKGNTEIIKTVFPYITLHKQEYPIGKMKSKMSSRDLFRLDDELIFLGICWFDSFSELLYRTDIPVYVLEDVYLRYRGAFDMIFRQHENDQHRFHIVTDHMIEYLNYLEGESNEMNISVQ